MMSAQCLPSTVDRAALRSESPASHTPPPHFPRSLTRSACSFRTEAEEDLLPARYDGLYRLEKFLVARKTVGGG